MLNFLQARNPAWTGVPFFAAFDEKATWLDQLRPAFGEQEFFFEAGMRDIVASQRNSGSLFSANEHLHGGLNNFNYPNSFRSGVTTVGGGCSN